MYSFSPRSAQITIGKGHVVDCSVFTYSFMGGKEWIFCLYRLNYNSLTTDIQETPVKDVADFTAEKCPLRSLRRSYWFFLCALVLTTSKLGFTLLLFLNPFQKPSHKPWRHVSLNKQPKQFLIKNIST